MSGNHPDLDRSGSYFFGHFFLCVSPKLTTENPGAGFFKIIKGSCHQLKKKPPELQKRKGLFAAYLSPHFDHFLSLVEGGTSFTGLFFLDVIPKCIFLYWGESGKSTIVKQMKILHPSNENGKGRHIILFLYNFCWLWLRAFFQLILFFNLKKKVLFTFCVSEMTVGMT